MLYEQFKKDVEDLDKEILNTYTQLQENFNEPFGFVRDGIVDIEQYYKQPNFKILWILKEPYGNFGKEGWSIIKNIKDARALNKKESKKDSLQTWHPIAYISYALQKEIYEYKNLEDIKVNTEINKSLLNIAFINIQKFGAKSRTNQANIIKAFKCEQIRNIILKQIEIYNPHIVIEGTNLRLVTSKLFETKRIEKANYGHYYSKDKIFINTYHPGQTKIKTLDYINNVLSRIKELKDKQQK